MVVADVQVAQPLYGASHQGATTAKHFEIKPHAQFVAARGDLKVAPVIQSLFVEALGHQHFTAGCRRRKIDPGHLRIDRGQWRLTTGHKSSNEQQQQLAHDEYPLI
ncbi:hypothetical protein D3C81_1873280 [compost metagenome]